MRNFNNGSAVRSLPLYGALCGLLLGLTPAWALAAEPGMKAGTVKVVQGDVRVSDGKGERVLHPGDALAPADRLVTGADGAASMVLRDGTTMMVGPRSRVNLDTFTFNSTTQEGNLAVSVLRGSLRMIDGLIAKTNPGAVAVHTPTATVGVRGTDFIVQVDDPAP